MSTWCRLRYCCCLVIIYSCRWRRRSCRCYWGCLGRRELRWHWRCLRGCCCCCCSCCCCGCGCCWRYRRKEQFIQQGHNNIQRAQSLSFIKHIWPHLNYCNSLETILLLLFLRFSVFPLAHLPLVCLLFLAALSLLLLCLLLMLLLWLLLLLLYMGSPVATAVICLTRTHWQIDERK